MLKYCIVSVNCKVNINTGEVETFSTIGVDCEFNFNAEAEITTARCVKLLYKML